MSASDVRLNTERIDAAAAAIYEAWVVAAHPAMRTLERREEWAEQANILAPIALAAADAAGSWNDTERLRTALTAMTSLVERELVSELSDNDIAIAFAYSGQTDVERDAIAEQQVRMLVAEARAALAESVPSPPAKAAP